MAVTIFTGRRTCRGCGCDDDHACPGGCAWVLLDVESPSGVCDACAKRMGWHQDGLRLVGFDPWGGDGGDDGDVLTIAEFAADPAGHARTLVLP